MSYAVESAIYKHGSYSTNENFSHYNNGNFPYLPTSCRSQYYNLEKQSIAPRHSNFFCEPCGQSFYTNGQYKYHVEQHIDCPFPQCTLSADMKVIDKHITHQHMMVNFDELNIDDEAWLSKRKKRFPSVRRAELRRALQIERLKRGERLKLGKDKFLDKGGNQFFKKVGYGSRGSLKKVETENDGISIGLNESATGKKEANCGENSFRMRRNRRNRRGFKNYQINDGPIVDIVSKFPPKVPPTIDLDESDDEFKNGIIAFKGIKSLYESTGELSLFGRTSEVCQDSANSDTPSLEISDDEWEPTMEKHASSSNELKFNNALGSLIGAYDSDSDSDGSNVETESKCKQIKTKIDEPANILNEGRKVDENQEISNKRCRSSHNRRNNKIMKGDNIVNSEVRRPRVYNRRRRPYLLERLLAPEIKHERNLILQCVRHVIESNFFHPQPNEEKDES